MELEADRLGAEVPRTLGYDPEAMIDVVRLLKNQEMFEIQRAREENREPRVYHGVFSSHPDNDTRLKEVVALGDSKVAADEQRPGQPRRVSEPHRRAAGRRERAQGVARASASITRTWASRSRSRRGWHVREPARPSWSALHRKKDAIAADADARRLAAGHGARANSWRACSRARGPSEASRSRSTGCRATRRSRSTCAALGQPGPGAHTRSSIMNNQAFVFFGASAHQPRRSQPHDAVSSVEHQDFRRLRQQRVRASRAGQDPSRAGDAADHHRGPREDLADREIRRAAAAAAERSVPGQGAEAGPADQDRRVSPARPRRVAAVALDSDPLLVQVCPARCAFRRVG